MCQVYFDRNQKIIPFFSNIFKRLDWKTLENIVNFNVPNLYVGQSTCLCIEYEKYCNTEDLKNIEKRFAYFLQVSSK